jgi:outer membrane lipoprotein LolB
MLKLKYLLITTLLVAISGCKQVPQDIPKLSLAARTEYLNNMHSWQANGKAGIRDKNQGQNVSIEWQQNGTNYNLHFFGPFGSGSIYLIGKPGKATLTTSDGHKYVGDDPETLVFENLGWELPFKGLIYWIKGQPAPHSAPSIKKYDQYNQLQVLQQDGWHIVYQSYGVYAPITLPEKMTLTNGNYMVKLIINSWETNSRR